MFTVDQSDWGWVTLHNRGCTCTQCQPFYNGYGNTASGIATSVIYITRQNWVELGCPGDIEAYYEALAKRETCPCCGQPKQQTWKLEDDTWKINFSV
jgi:hypothetical protein